jgi:hypothetical protein
VRSVGISCRALTLHDPGTHLLTHLVAKSNKSAAPRRVSQNKTPRGQGSLNPPMLNATITSRHRLRFVNQTAVNRVITPTEILDLLCVGITATSASRVCDGMKIEFLELWAANDEASNTVECEWLNDASGNFGPGKTFSDTALGVTNIAHVACAPPKDSSAAFWLNDTHGDVGILRLALPAGAVTDMVLQLVLYDNDNPILVSGAVAAASPGKFYCRALDNGNATPQVYPVSYDYI